VKRLALVIATCAACAPARAQAPARLDVGLDEHLGAAVPHDLPFTDTTGRRLQLQEIFDDRRPVLLVMAYARCQMLCSVVLEGVAEAVRASDLVPGTDYQLVVVSLDPHETLADARARQAALASRIGRRGDATTWRYLIGDPEPVATLARALGFRYSWDERTKQYAHPAVVFVLTPAGRIAEYVRGVRFPDGVIEAALQRANAGGVGPSTQADLLTCFHFDPSLTRYRARLELYFQIGAALIFFALAGAIGGLVLWERRRGRRRR
jgi:protein SCO1/2